MVQAVIFCVGLLVCAVCTCADAAMFAALYVPCSGESTGAKALVASGSGSVFWSLKSISGVFGAGLHRKVQEHELSWQRG